MNHPDMRFDLLLVRHLMSSQACPVTGACAAADRPFIHDVTPSTPRSGRFGNFVCPLMIAAAMVWLRKPCSSPRLQRPALDAGLTARSREARRSKQDGGARRDRTDDLMLAKHALYQLSYGPAFAKASARQASTSASGQAQWLAVPKRRQARRMVGPGRLELPTSRLSGVRSNQLSYGPGARAYGPL